MSHVNPRLAEDDSDSRFSLMNLREFRLQTSAIQLSRNVKLERLTPKMKVEADGGGEELIKPAEREALKVITTCRAKSRC